MRCQASIKEGYEQVIEKILKFRPHHKNKASVIEMALDYYLDYLVREDKGDKK